MEIGAPLALLAQASGQAVPYGRATRGSRTGAELAELCATIKAEVEAKGAALMGVVNATPDSFYDGGRYTADDTLHARIDALIEAGSAIIDIGGESSRPSADPVPSKEQIRRVRPAISHAVARGALVSIDTTSPEVARFALGEGARIVNDVSCLGDDDLARAAAEHRAALILTHARGPMSKMRDFSSWPEGDYGDVVTDVLAEWRAARTRAVEAGVSPELVWFDPGLGFSKSARHSLELLARLREFSVLDTVLVVGPGRKSFIASVDPAPSAADRLGGTVAACLVAAARGAQVLRIHDVREVRQALALTRAVKERKAEAEAPGVR